MPAIKKKMLFPKEMKIKKRTVYKEHGITRSRLFKKNSGFHGGYEKD